MEPMKALILLYEQIGLIEPDYALAEVCKSVLVNFVLENQ